MDTFNAPAIICRICGRAVTIATCTVDDNGKAVHEECYGREAMTSFDKPLIFPRRNENDGIEFLSLRA